MKKRAIAILIGICLFPGLFLSAQCPGDFVPPVINCPSNKVSYLPPGQCTLSGCYIGPFASDNCLSAQTTFPGYTLLSTALGHRYYLSDSLKTWAQANSEALAMGGHLVSFNSLQEQNLVSQSLSTPFWIGMQRLTPTAPMTWMTGEHDCFKWWCPGEPNNGGGGSGPPEPHAVANWCQSGRWNDVPNLPSQQYRSIVEFDVPMQLLSGLPGIYTTGPGIFTQIWEATDLAGNRDTCSFTITVLDTLSPQALCQDLTVFLDSTGNAQLDPLDLNGGSTDNCGLASLIAFPASLGCSSIGPNPITLTVLDQYGNSGSCTSIVTVVDPFTLIPDFGFEENKLTVDFSDSSQAGRTYTHYWDFGDGNSSTQSQPVHVYAAPGAYEVCLTITDACDSATICDSVRVKPCKAEFEQTQPLSDCPMVQFCDTITEPHSFYWVFAPGDTSLDTCPFRVFPFDTNIPVQFIIETQNGCRDTTTDTIRFEEENFNDPQPTLFTPLSWQPRLQGHPLDTNMNFIEDCLDTLRSGDTVNLIVCLNQHFVNSADSIRFSQWGQIGYQSQYLTLLELTQVDSTHLDSIAAHPKVAFVFKDDSVHAVLDDALKSMRATTSTLYAPNTVEDQIPILKGQGVGIAFLDTGVDDNGHQTFNGTDFRGGINILTGQIGNPADDNGHGTAVAGAALGKGTGPNKSGRGIAPGASLIDVKVLNQQGTGTMMGIIRGIDWVILNRKNLGIDVLNISLSSAKPDNGTHPMSYAVDRAVFYGLVAVVAAGNRGAAGLTIPGTATDAITVGAADGQGTVDRANDIPSGMSSVGPRIDGYLKPELTAPGVNLDLPVAGTNAQFSLRSGTSFATGLVSGLAALLHQLRPNRPPLSVRNLLKISAEKRTPSAWDPQWGHGLVDAFQAVDTCLHCAPSDLKFKEYCRQPGNSNWWKSADLRLKNGLVVDGVPNVINVRVSNAGPSAPDSFLLRVGIYGLSNGDDGHVIDEIVVRGADVPAANGDKWYSFPWTPSLTTGTKTVHGCLKAKIIYFCDTKYRNNCAQRNVNIQHSKSPALFQFDVYNNQGFDLLTKVHFAYTPKPGWTVVRPDTQFFMLRGSPPQTLKQLVIPDSTVPMGDSLSIDVEIQAEIEIEGRVYPKPIGGLTLMAVKSSALQASVSGVQAVCPGDSARNIIAWISGGLAPNSSVIELSSNPPGSYFQTFSGDSVVFPPLPPASYTAIATDTNSFSDSVSFTIGQLVPVVANFSDSVLDSVATFTDLSTGNPTSWNWDFGDGGVSAQQNPVHTYQMAGVYQVRLIVNGQCGPDTFVDSISILPVGLEDEVSPDFLSLFPNPSGGRFTLQFKGGPVGSLHIRVWDFGGGLVWESRKEKRGTELEIMVDLSEFSRGVYLVEVAANEQRWHRKVVVK